MLIPNKIPSEEPDINVGIIMPEDKQTTLNLKIPADRKYNLSSIEVKEEIAAGTLINLAIENGKMVVKFKKTV